VSKLAARALEQAAYASAAHIVALSPGMREGIERTTLRRRPVTIVSNACDFDVFAPRAGDADAFLRAHPRLAGRTLAIYAGTFGEINGVGYLVELAAHTRRIAPRVAFVLVGDGKERAATQTRVRALGLQDTVFFLDPVPKPELRRILAAATAAFSVFIDLPAMWANSANKFFDALASGTPVVINYGGWQADLLRETGAGLVLPSTPTSLAARRLATWLQGPESVRAAEATATLAARFDRDHLTARLLTLLEETAVGSPRSPRGGPDRGRSGRS
jgi:glycosyltransferase involved in cell wall biosynthesis